MIKVEQILGIIILTCTTIIVLVLFLPLLDAGKAESISGFTVGFGGYYRYLNPHNVYFQWKIEFNTANMLAFIIPIIGGIIAGFVCLIDAPLYAKFIGLLIGFSAFIVGFLLFRGVEGSTYYIDEISGLRGNLKLAGFKNAYGIYVAFVALFGGALASLADVVYVVSKEV